MGTLRAPMSSAMTDRQLLVVDDEQETCDLLQMVLEREGYAVTTSTSPQHALELVAARDFELSGRWKQVSGGPGDRLRSPHTQPKARALSDGKLAVRGGFTSAPVNSQLARWRCCITPLDKTSKSPRPVASTTWAWR